MAMDRSGVLKAREFACQVSLREKWTVPAQRVIHAQRPVLSKHEMHWFALSENRPAKVNMAISLLRVHRSNAFLLAGPVVNGLQLGVRLPSMAICPVRWWKVDMLQSGPNIGRTMFVRL